MSQAIQVLRENLRSFVEQFDDGNRRGNNEEVKNVAVEDPGCFEADERGRRDLEVETHRVFCDAAARNICQRPGIVILGRRKSNGDA